MPLVRATNSGAKTILAHFHYCYKGQRLFTKPFDWKSARVRKMARLDPEQTAFMAQCRDLVVEKGKVPACPTLLDLNLSHYLLMLLIPARAGTAL